MTHVRGILEAIEEAASGAANGIYANYTIGLIVTGILTSRRERKALIIQNLGPDYVYIGFDNTVTALTGIRLITREVYANSSYSGEIWVISAGVSDLRVEEVY